MAMTPKQAQQDQDDFVAAYEEDAPDQVAQTDDDAFGLVPDESAIGDDGMPNSPEEATEVVAEEDSGGHPPGLTLEEQRAKSWEGRKRAQALEIMPQEQPMAKEAPADEVMETPAEEAGEPEVSELLEEAAAKTEGMGPDEALKALAADFGDDFASMLSAIIDAKVAQVGEGVNKSVNEIIEDIVDTKAKAHFEAIADKHPDFMDVAESAEFKAYCEATPECAKVVESGSAREINKMLDTYKKQAKTEPQQDDPSMDAAEGVRSSGMRLPKEPSSSSDYSAAWDEA